MGIRAPLTSASRAPKDNGTGQWNSENFWLSLFLICTRDTAPNSFRMFVYMQRSSTTVPTEKLWNRSPASGLREVRCRLPGAWYGAQEKSHSPPWPSADYRSGPCTGLPCMWCAWHGLCTISSFSSFLRPGCLVFSTKAEQHPSGRSFRVWQTKSDFNYYQHHNLCLV